MKQFFNLLLVVFLLAGLFGAQPGRVQAGGIEAQASLAEQTVPQAVDASTPKLSDANLRQAVAYCTDKAALVRSVYPLLSDVQINSLLRDSFLPASSPDYHAPATQYPFNQSAGRALLLSAGWSLPNGGSWGSSFLVNASGEELAVKLTATNSSFRQTFAAVLETQLMACGIRLLRFHVASQWWFGQTTGLARRDFEAGEFAWVDGIYQPYETLYACDQVPTAANGWQGQNNMGWCNPTASEAVKTAAHSLSPATRAAQYVIAQDAFGLDMPSLPLFSRTDIYAYRNTLTGFTPGQNETANYAYNIAHWAIAGRSSLTWGMTQEPGTLFDIQNSYPSSLILGVVQGLPYTTTNYAPQPLLQAPFATLENGQAANNTITVNAGDKVVDSRGNVATLANGVSVRDASGTVVTFSGAPLSMKQLVVPYTFLSNLEWSDGEAVAQADFALGYQVACSPDSGNADYSTCERAKSVLFNAHGYTVTWLPGYDSQAYSLAPFPYYPAHRLITSPGPHQGQTLGQVPPADWASLPEVSTNPLGAGPYAITNWVKGQYIDLAANPHYALGTPATPAIHIQFLSDSTVAETALINGTADLLGPDVLTYLSQALHDAAGISKTILPSPTWDHVDFNFDFPQPPSIALDSPTVRQAISLCTNKAELAKSVYPNLTNEQVNGLVLNTFLPASHWAYHAPDPVYTSYSQDLGKALLDQAGWTLDPNSGYRKNAAGEELALKLTTTTAVFRQTWAAAWESQMKACGVRVLRFHVPSSWWFGDTTGLQRRDFETGAFAWVGQPDPGGLTLYACDQIPTAANNWHGQNDMGWCNPAASAAIKAANNSLLMSERQQQYAIFQDEFAKDEPSVPLFNRLEVYVYRNDLTDFSPAPGEMYYTADISHWAVPGQNTIKLALTQEPASLFGLQSNSWVTGLILAAVEGRPYTSYNYSYQPLLQAPFATLENGQAQNNTVTVNAGDKVMDAGGSVVTLANGVKVIDASGNTVTFSGTPIQMKQLTVPYTFLSNLKWSDGQLVAQEDFQLGYTVACDHTSGATSYAACDPVGGITFNPHGYTVSWLPGYQAPNYFLAPFPYYPAHRLITSPGTYNGQLLSQVPPAAWGSLPEVTKYPLGAGPYQVTVNQQSWYIELTANPYYALGTPATPTIRIDYYSPSNLEPALISGAADLAGPDSLFDVSAAVKNAANLSAKTLPSPTWEHIDFNLGFTQTSTLPVSAAGGTASVSTVTEAGPAAAAFSGASGSGSVNIATNPAYQGVLPAGQPYLWPPFDVSVSGGFSFSQVSVSLPYNPGEVQAQKLDESTLKLLHLENGAWVDVTTGVDTFHHQVSGSVGSLSPFLITGTKSPSNYISIWHQWGGAYLNAIQQYFNQYMTSHPGLHITLSNANDMTGALNLAIPAGDGPDIISWANDAIGINAQKGFLADLALLGVTDSFLNSTYEPAAAAGVKWNGKIWALPESIESIALVYNPSLVTTAYRPSDPLNFADLASKAAAFKTATGKPLICNQGFPGGDAYHIAPVFFGFGLPGYVDDAGNAYANTTQAIAAGTWLSNMPPLSPPEQNFNSCRDALLAGNVGMWWTGPWAIAELEANHFSYGIVPMGKPFVGIKTLMVTSNAVSRGSAAPSLDLIKAFTGFEASKAITLANKTIPANTAALHDPEVQALTTIARFGAAADLGVPMSPSVYSGCQWGPMGEAETAIWNGSQTPTSALNTAQNQILACVRTIKMTKKVFLPVMKK